jgi:hypothetical protein
MSVIAIFGALVVGGAIFAAFKNLSKSAKGKFTKLDIG